MSKNGLPFYVSPSASTSVFLHTEISGMETGSTISNDPELCQEKSKIIEFTKKTPMKIEHENKELKIFSI